MGPSFLKIISLAVTALVACLGFFDSLPDPESSRYLERRGQTTVLRLPDLIREVHLSRLSMPALEALSEKQLQQAEPWLRHQPGDNFYVPLQWVTDAVLGKPMSPGRRWLLRHSRMVVIGGRFSQETTEALRHAFAARVLTHPDLSRLTSFHVMDLEEGACIETGCDHGIDDGTPFLYGLEGVAAASRITELTVDRHGLDALQGVASRLTGLRRLSVRQLGNKNPLLLFPALQELTAGSGGRRPEDLRAVATKLSVLDEAYLPQLIEADVDFPRLRQLWVGQVGNKGFTPKDAAQLGSSPHLAALKSLKVMLDGETTPGFVALLGSLSHPQLQELTIKSHYAVYDAAAFGALCRAPGAKHLRSLTILFGTVTPAGARALASCPALRELTLQFTHLGDAGLAALLKDTQLVNLERLSLLGDDLGPSAVRTLVASGVPRTLRELELRENNIGDPGALALASENFPLLEHLELSRTEIGETGTAALLRSPHFPNLHFLDVEALWNKSLQPLVAERWSDALLSQLGATVKPAQSPGSE